MKKILITGVPRGATKYIYVLLRTLGHSVLFEKKGTCFTVSWKHIKSGYFENPCPENNINNHFDKIIHQTRHPLPTISSMSTLWAMSMNYIGKFVALPDEIINRNNTVKNCMVAYKFWNEEIEKKAKWRYRIEELPEVYEEWCKQLEIPVKPLPIIGKVNSREHDSLSWEDLEKRDKTLAEEIKSMAIKYGYKV